MSQIHAIETQIPKFRQMASEIQSRHVVQKVSVMSCRIIHRGYSNFLLNMAFISPSEVENIFIIYKVMKYRKILMKYNVYFIFSLVKI